MSSDATNWPIGGIQSLDVTISIDSVHLEPLPSRDERSIEYTRLFYVPWLKWLYVTTENRLPWKY